MTLDAATQRRIGALLRAHRWVSLASLGKDGPECSWVAMAPEADFQGILLHLSRLASHTRNLLREPRACLAVSEPEHPSRDPQTLARLSLFGTVAVIPRESADHTAAAARYQERLPDAVPLFDFSDFQLFRMRVERARFVGGFAQAYSLDPAALKGVARVQDPGGIA